MKLRAATREARWEEPQITQIAQRVGKGKQTVARIERDPRTYAILGAAMEVHKELGRGFLEAVYQEAMEIEFRERNIPFEREVELPIHYRGKRLGTSYRADFLCFNEVVVETKALRAITNVEKAQVINYLKATDLKVGLLLNFGARSLEYERLVDHY